MAGREAAAGVAVSSRCPVFVAAMKPSPLLLLITVSLAAIGVTGYVAQGTREGARAPDPPISSRENYNISFERTGCYGNCPAFALTIDGEGNTLLRMHARQENPSRPYETEILLYGSKLAPQQHASLIAGIEKGGFRRLKLDYAIQVTDAPSTTIAIDTPRGHWSTEVYAVPCAKEGTKLSESDRRDFGITEFVPDIFCELSERLDAIACDTYLRGTRLGPDHDLKPFMPPHCRKTP